MTHTEAFRCSLPLDKALERLSLFRVYSQQEVRGPRAPKLMMTVPERDRDEEGRPRAKLQGSFGLRSFSLTFTESTRRARPETEIQMEMKNSKMPYVSMGILLFLLFLLGSSSRSVDILELFGLMLLAAAVSMGPVLLVDMFTMEPTAERLLRWLRLAMSPTGTSGPSGDA